MADAVETFGQRMRRLRGELGISQADLAEECGIDQGRISKLELGKLLPKNGEADKLIRALTRNATEVQLTEEPVDQEEEELRRTVLLLRRFRRMSQDKQQLLLNIAKVIATQ